MKKSNKVPPDGGYGWVIVFANALSNFIATPLMHCFGLIFNITFAELGLTATQSSLIINLNAAFGMMTGLINGVLLKMYGCRKVAMFASFLLTFGVVLTSYSRTFTHFIISYGLITSLGMGLCQSAYSLSVYTYFVDKRSYAVGLSETITGFGPIVIPQIISVLMTMYTPDDVTLIFGGICAHVFIAAALLQPVKWHMKIKEENGVETETVSITMKCSLNKTITEETSSSEEEKKEESEEKPTSDDIKKIDDTGGSNEITENENDSNKEKTDEQKKQETNKTVDNTEDLNIELTPKEEITTQQTNNGEEKQNSEIKSKRNILMTIVTMFDLDLLKDPIFVNIMMGLALAIFAELNFTVLTPFMLHDYGLDTSQIAIFLSVLGGADIVFRFFAPHIGNMFTTSPRWMYACSLFLLMLTRFTFLLSKNFYILIAIALGLGVAKGVRKVYMSLVIPDYVSIDKLATASGMEMMMNGFCIMIGGPLLGVVRDVTGSYTWCVIIMNCVTFTTITMWIIEVVIIKLKKVNIKEKKVMSV